MTDLLTMFERHVSNWVDRHIANDETVDYINAKGVYIPLAYLEVYKK